MKECTIRRERRGVLVDQETHTGGARTYATHVRRLSQAERRKDNSYRFRFRLPYKDPRLVEGVITCTVAEWRVVDGTKSARVGCFTRRVFFERHVMVVDVVIRAKNIEVLTLNIEGRVVDKKSLTLG